ncbi:MAG: hypothetical protein FJ125_15780, partial [Deltaproteobacteria bacterium]|nr:hypothetical protein [Deltaproteobacteria bacterium]
MDDSLVGQVLDAVQGRATAERGAAWRTCEAQRDSTAKVTFDRALLEELATLRFIDAHQRVLILGPVGVGKTFLAHALGHIACRRGYSVQLSSTEKLLKRLKAGRLDQSHEEELRRLITVDLLILDDFAMGP